MRFSQHPFALAGHDLQWRLERLRGRAALGAGPADLRPDRGASDETLGALEHHGNRTEDFN